MNAPQNVSEIYPLHDTVLVSQQLFGNEISVKGWFGGHAGNKWARPFDLFSKTPEHLFFKERTEGNSDPAYCNLQSAETMDFPYRLYSIGVRFWGPISAFEVAPRLDPAGAGMYPWGAITMDDPFALNSAIGHIWKAELPMHMSLEFKVEQDVLLEGPCMTFPPGHGFVGGGSAWNGPVGPGESALVEPLMTVGTATAGTIYDYNFNITPAASGQDSIVQHPQHISIVNQGHPRIGNRFNFVDSKGDPAPIEIPKGALIQASVKASPYSSYLLQDVMGPLYYLFNRRAPRMWVDGNGTPTADANTWFGTRYGITVSLLGERLVQQRANYWYGPSAITPAQ